MIELLVVIAIIGALAAVLLMVINPVEIMRKSRDAKRFSAMETIKSAIDLSLADGQTIPETGTGYIALNSSTNVADIDPDVANVFNVSKYLPSFPQDPAYAASGSINGIVTNVCATGAINKSEMAYRLWGDVTTNTYILRAHMESASNCNAVKTDGNDNSTLELGTDPGLDAF